jgi:hypothetical protein
MTWLKQEPGKLLFPDLEWSRPENKLAAGKLLVVGGNAHGFAAPAEAYGEALSAGVGVCRAFLPQSIQKIVGVIIGDAEFAPSTAVSGGFSQQALGELLAQANWADGIIFAGDLGRNSETAILLEKFLAKSPAPTTLVKDAIDYAISSPETVLERDKTMLVMNLDQLQHLGMAARFELPITHKMDLLHLVDWLQKFSKKYAPIIVVHHLDNTFVAIGGKVSSTKSAQSFHPLKTATHAAVWWLQNPSKPFESITTSLAVG